MPTDWTTVHEDDQEFRLSKYSWRVPNNDQQHVRVTTTPGDLRIKPEDITEIPTLSPKQSGIQHGADTWEFESTSTDSWYIEG